MDTKPGSLGWGGPDKALTALRPGLVLSFARLRVPSSQEPAGPECPRNKWTVQAASKWVACSRDPSSVKARTLHLPAPEVTDAAMGHRSSPPNTFTHVNKLVCTHTPTKHTHVGDTCGHTVHKHMDTHTPAPVACWPHSPCLGLPDAMVCALPARVARLKLLPSPPGQLGLRLPLPTRTGPGPPWGLDNCRVSFGTWRVTQIPPGCPAQQGPQLPRHLTEKP